MWREAKFTSFFKEIWLLKLMLKQKDNVRKSHICYFGNVTLSFTKWEKCCPPKLSSIYMSKRDREFKINTYAIIYVVNVLFMRKPRIVLTIDCTNAIIYMYLQRMPSEWFWHHLTISIKMDYRHILKGNSYSLNPEENSNRSLYLWGRQWFLTT